MAEKKTVGSVTYTQTDNEYFAKRGLRRYARVWSLWALGVGAVISGHYSGWNFGLQYGFGAMLIALFVIAAMYWGLIFSIAEMSPALPHTGAAYSFARSALGPWGGMVTGLAESIEYILTPAVIVFFIGSYMTAIFETPAAAQPLWWAGAYAVFLLLNLRGVELSFKVSVLVTLGALAVLALYWVSAIPHFDLDRWALNIGVGADGSKVELPEGGGSWLPFGIGGALAALPFAVWLFLAIEQLPLAAEESTDPKQDMPRGLLYGMTTLMISALLISFLNSGVGSTDPDKMHGAFSLSSSAEPLLDGFRVIYGTGTAKVLAFLAVIGLIASFHTIIYAYGRNVFSLSRAGYYPHFLSLTHGKRNTPYVALIAGAVIGFGLAFLVDQALKNDWLGGNLYAALLSMAVAGAVVSYFLQMISFILLRRNLPDIERPYRSPVGVWGAAIGAVIALASLAACFWRDDYRPGVVGVAIFYLLALVYFGLRGRHQLVLSPEEEFALTRGQHGHPETEGYGTTSVADIPKDVD